MKNHLDLQILLGFAYALLTSQIALADPPPDPFISSQEILSVKFNVSRPVTDTQEKFLAVRALMNKIDNETAGVAEHHPEKNVSCDKCHATDAVSVDHYGLVIDESNPEKSCSRGGCHDLVVAGEMPFYVKPFVTLDATNNAKIANQRLLSAKRLLSYTKNLKENLKTRASSLPTLNNFSIDIKAEDKRINNLTHDTALTFFEPENAFQSPKDADLLPKYATTELVDDLFSTLSQDLAVATRLTGIIEAKVARAEHLEKYLDLLNLNSTIESLLSNSQWVLRYNATLPDEAFDFVGVRLLANLPLAKATTDVKTGDSVLGIRRTKTWQIPSADNDGKIAATIVLRINTPGTRIQASTELQFQRLAKHLYPLAVLTLKELQSQYLTFNADHARYTLSYLASTDLDKALLNTAFNNSKDAAWKGELRRNLAYAENTSTGTISAPGLVDATVAAVKASAQANPAGVRRLRSTLRYKADMATVSQISNEVLSGSLPKVSISAPQLNVTESGKAKVGFTVSLATTVNKPLTVYYTLKGDAVAGKDFEKPKLSVTIPKGQLSTQVAIKLVNDKKAEPDKSLVMALSWPKATNYTLSSTNNVSVVIIDDDKPK